MAFRARRVAPDMTVAEFDRWCAAKREVAAIQEVSAEEGGPRVTLVPDSQFVPLDFLPDEVILPAIAAPPAIVPVPGTAIAAPTGPESSSAIAFTPEPSRKTGGWSAERQRLFIENLAETGSVHMAARSAGLSPRSAYGLRVRSAPFAAAWDAAQQLAVGRLSALAFDRAIHGRVEQVYHDGNLVGERRVPSERLLMWLLARLDPKRFAAPWERRKGDAPDPQADAQRAFPALLAGLGDVAAD